MYIGLGIAVALALLAGLGWYTLSDSQEGAMEAKDKSGGMMEDKTKDAMESKGDSMMQKEVGTDPSKQDSGMMEKPKADTMMGKGGYETYAPEKLVKAKEGDVVLFFRASWCPMCRGLDADIKANMSNIPAGVTILDVNYDTETALKQKYGVTYQHTLVQVDAQGKQIAKWQGSPTLTALLGQVK
jgi:thioredoxin 1